MTVLWTVVLDVRLHVLRHHVKKPHVASIQVSSRLESMKPRVANAQTLLETFCGTKLARRSDAKLCEEKRLKSFQVAYIARRSSLHFGT